MSLRAEAEPQARDGVVTRADGLQFLAPDRAAAFLGLLRAASTLDNTLNQQLEKEHGLSLRAFEVLLFLSVFTDDGEMSMSDLRAETPLSQSRVSRLVAELERRDLVHRTASDSDARGVNVTITRAGVDKFKSAQETHLAGLEEHLFGLLSEREVHQLARITNKILQRSADT